MYNNASGLTGQIAQCEQLIGQLMQQTRQSSQMYQQMLQQEQQNAATLEQLAQRERQAAQNLQIALQGHDTAMRMMQQASELCRRLEQTAGFALNAMPGNSIGAGGMLQQSFQ